ncbi:MAG: VWA domain-containing protein [Sandaracinaceae bacterium]|nr:VWA domain-containing protein [Sandaracinaceae bacterium]
MSFAAFPMWAVLSAMGLVATLVVGLYLLRRTPRPLVVSNIDFWMRAAQHAKPRLLASFRIPLLALLVSLLVALAMVALLGDPRFGAGVRGTTVIVIDAGRSMGASGDDGERRVDHAVAEVRRWVERSTIAGEVSIVRAGMRPEVILPITEHAGDLEAALTRLETDDGPSDVRAAVALADAIVLERSRIAAAAAGTPMNGTPILGQILLVTDRDVELATQAPLVTLPVGSEIDTLAITSFAARRVPEAVGEYAVRLELENFSSRTARARVHVVDGDVDLLNERVTLAPHASQVLEAGGFSSHRAELHADLETIGIDGSDDGFAGDDSAVAVVEALDATRVLLVTDGNRYLEAALGSHPGLDVQILAPAALASLSSTALSRFHAIVLDHASLPSGVEHRAVVIFAPLGGRDVGIARTLSRPRITGTLASHPVLEGLRFEDVGFDRASALTERAGDQVLLRSREHVMAFARETRRGRLVVFGFATADTDLVRREAFPLLVHDALRWAADRGEASPLARPVGQSVLVEAGEEVTGPDGEPIAVSGGELPEITRAGLYHVGERALAFGATRHAGALRSGSTGGRFVAESQLPPLAVIVAAILLAVMMLEWFFLHRGRLE